MKKLKIILILFISLFIFASTTQAKVILKKEGEGSIVIEKSEVITDDLFLAADTVDIFGTIDGDVYVGAGVVNFSGSITGDLIVGSGKVYINGQIGDDLVVGAGDLTVTDSTIGDGMLVGAGSIKVDDQSKINGSLLAGTGMLDNQAPVLRNLMVGAGNFKHNAPVGGEAYIGGEDVSFGPKTVINGNLTYATEKDLQIDDQAVILGETKRHTPKSNEWNNKQFKMNLNKNLSNAKYAFKVISFFSSLIVGLVLLWLLKKPTLAIAGNIKSKFLSSLGWGLVLVILTFPALMLLAITGVGFPLAAILAMVFIIELSLAKLFTAMAIGLTLDKYLNWKKVSPQVTFSLGLLALYLLKLIPGVGAFVSLIALLSGLGGIWIYTKKQLK